MLTGATAHPAETVIVAQGTASFIEEGVRYSSEHMPFEELRWEKRPSTRAVRAALPTQPKTWLYAAFECRGVGRSGRLYGCRIVPFGHEEIVATSRRTLSLLKYYAVSPSDGMRLHRLTKSVFLRFQIKVGGVRDSGHCGALGFCAITPPPPPPPAPLAGANGS